MAGIDPDLLKSPHSDSEPRRGLPVAGVAAVAVVLAVVGVIAWVIWTGDDAAESASDAGTTTTAGSVADITLVEYAPTPALLAHPTVLPDEWDACSVTDDYLDPDRFCGRTEDQWVEVEFMFPRPSDRETAVPTGVHDGEWTSPSNPLEARFPINEHVSLAVRAEGLDESQLVEIARSIPVLADRASLYGAYELPIDWEAMTGDDLVGLLDQFEGDATVDLGRFELTVRTSNASLYGFNSRGFWTADASSDLPRARLVDSDRPLVVGESQEMQKGYAVWDQAGFAWRLEGNLTAEETAALALSVIAKLANLPLDLTR